jgi:hypothetical protein
MRNHIKWVAVVVFAGIVGMGMAALSTAPAAAGSKCWQVECNTCCRGGGGGVICTQRACV